MQGTRIKTAIVFSPQIQNLFGTPLYHDILHVLDSRSGDEIINYVQLELFSGENGQDVEEWLHKFDDMISNLYVIPNKMQQTV